MATAGDSIEDLSPAKTLGGSDGLFEVIGKTVIGKPPMGVLESTLASLLLELMGPFARSMKLGQVFCEVLFDLRPAVDRSYRPDLAFLSAAKWPIHRRGPQTESWPIIPDLAVEVISTSNLGAVVLLKVRDYLRAGVELVWVIYPSAEEIHVFDAQNPSIVGRLQRGDVLRGGRLISGFELPLSTLFGEGEKPESATA
jgi:Uma2 family endonuclease